MKYIFSSYVQGLDILILKVLFPISSEVRVKAICINEEKLQKDFKTGFFFRPRQKNSRTKKLKIQKKNSKLKQKTQGFGNF